METKIKWNEGEGYITATYEGSGNGSASISSDVNEGIDREQSIKVETTDKSVSATLVVSQEGLREVFEPSDGEFVLADGGTFNVLKIGGGKIINKIRLTLKKGSFVDIIVNPDTMDYPLVWDYPVASDVSLDHPLGGGYILFNAGEQSYSTPMRYWQTDEYGDFNLIPNPSEDDTYIYKVEIV